MASLKSCADAPVEYPVWRILVADDTPADAA
jgi:hypothetical protein